VGTRLLSLLQILIYNLNYSAGECAPNAGLQKRATFSTLFVGLAGTGNQPHDYTNESAYDLVYDLVPKKDCN
jgi:hypothetical protein